MVGRQKALLLLLLLSLVVKACKKNSQDLLWHALNRLQTCALILEWVVLWPNSLIAGIYDSVDATGPVAEVDYTGNRERKGALC